MNYLNDERSLVGVLAMAGIKVLNIKPLPDGYSYRPSDPRYFENPPQQVWWFVKTHAGWIEIGRRKRVFNIDWSDTPIRWKGLTADDTTKDPNLVHAWTLDKLVEYLATLAPFLNQTYPEGWTYEERYA